MKTTDIRAVSPIPNQRMVSGIQAKGGTGRISWKIGKTIHFSFVHQAIAMPSGMPITAATLQPKRTM